MSAMQQCPLADGLRSVIFVNENENAKTAKLVTQRKC